MPPKLGHMRHLDLCTDGSEGFRRGMLSEDVPQPQHMRASRCRCDSPTPRHQHAREPAQQDIGARSRRHHRCSKSTASVRLRHSPQLSGLPGLRWRVSCCLTPGSTAGRSRRHWHFMVHGPLHPEVRRPCEAIPKLLAAPGPRKTYTEKRRDATEAAELREGMRSGTLHDPFSPGRHSGWPRRATSRSSIALLPRRW